MPRAVQSGGILVHQVQQAQNGNAHTTKLCAEDCFQNSGYLTLLIYLMATCFPRHFYAATIHDPASKLGCATLSYYASATNPHGFASTLSMTHNLVTHSSSSCSTYPIMMAFCYDMQANKVAGDIDSRLINRSGLRVDVKNKDGFTVRDKDVSHLSESIDSHQAALDLVGIQPFFQFDWFFTFTSN